MRATRAGLTPVLAGLAALAVAWPALRNGWSGFDEGFYVRDNMLLRTLEPETLWLLLTSPGGGGQFQPVTMLSFALNFALAGDSVLAFHAVDVLLYALITALVALLTQRVVGDVPGYTAREATTAGFAAGLLFAVHPLHVETFSWIADRKDLLATLLGLLAFLDARRARRASSRRGLVVGHLRALVLYALALASKLSVPPLGLLIALDAMLFDPAGRDLPLRGRAKRAALAGAPFLVIGFAATLLFLQGKEQINPRQGPEGWGYRALFIVRCLGHYVSKLVWPTGLSVYYWPRYDTWAWVRTLLPLLPTALALGVLLRRPGRHRAPVLFGAAWFLLMLFPLLNLYWHGHYVADRYVFLPSVGVAVAAGALLAAALRTRFAQHARAAGLVAVCLLLIASGSRIPAWRDAGALWSSALEANPDHPIAMTNLAAWRAGQDDPAGARALLERAHTQEPHYSAVTLAFAKHLETRGDRAAADALIAEHVAAGEGHGYWPTAIVLYRAQQALRDGDLDLARALADERLERFPSDPVALAIVGKVHLARGEFADALVVLERAMYRAATRDATLHAAIAARETGDLERATRYLRWVEAAGATWRTHLERARLALAREDVELARRSLQPLVTDPPSTPHARRGVALTLVRAGLPHEALALLRRAEQETGLDPSGTYDLARLEQLYGDRARARELLNRDPRLAERAATDPAFKE